jgi:hypothetical protein
MDVANVRYGRYVRFGGHSGMAFWDYCWDFIVDGGMDAHCSNTGLTCRSMERDVRGIQVRSGSICSTFVFKVVLSM